MKDLIAFTVAGILLYWVMIWPDSAYANIVFEDNKIWIVYKVFLF
jgi:cytochrome c oxidase assembly factor CtaG